MAANDLMTSSCFILLHHSILSLSLIRQPLPSPKRSLRCNRSFTGRRHKEPRSSTIRRPPVRGDESVLKSFPQVQTCMLPGPTPSRRPLVAKASLFPDFRSQVRFFRIFSSSSRTFSDIQPPHHLIRVIDHSPTPSGSRIRVLRLPPRAPNPGNSNGFCTSPRSHLLRSNIAQDASMLLQEPSWRPPTSLKIPPTSPKRPPGLLQDANLSQKCSREWPRNH